MSLEPKIYLFSPRFSNIQRVGKSALSEQLSETAKQFTQSLIDKTSNSLYIKVKEVIPSANLDNHQFIPFLNLEIINENIPREEIYIYAQDLGDELRFIISPGSVVSGYDFLEDKDLGEIRTIALKEICDSLFSISNADILITTHSEDPGPTSSYQAYREWLPNSTFSLISTERVLSNGLFLRSLDSLHVFEGSVGSKIRLSVTDHPFSLSGYNSLEQAEPTPFLPSSFLKYKLQMQEFCVDLNDRGNFFLN